MEKFDLKSVLKVTMAFLRITGLWPYAKNYSWNVYTLYAVTSIIFLPFTHTVSQIINFFFIYDDLEALAASLYVVVSYVLILTKTVCFVKKLSTMKLLMRNLGDDVFQPRNQHQNEILHNSMGFWKIVFNVFAASTAGTLILLTAYPLLDKSYKDSRLPFLAWYPFDVKPSPIYEVTYTYQMISTYFGTAINFYVDILITAHMVYIAAQCQLLCSNLKNLDGFAGEQIEDLTVSIIPSRIENGGEDMALREFYDNFEFCIRHHQAILLFSENLNKFLDFIVFSQFAASILIICMTMFQLSIVTPLSSKFFSLLVYQFCASVQIFLYCWFGNEVIIQSQKIPQAMYESNWINTPITFKKNVVFFILRTQTPIILRALNFFAISVETFTTIVRTSWSYFALLRQVNGENKLE